ncbi:PspC domain-containing protein [Candidatus Saccharibacteria bacterium]|nr:PspC domain-containing protein [Candidatus Saccharibacteria bacterium]NCU40872.1 PspC domain-containing protein [Candidatus Saccharibacteria bacterium]
MKKLYRSESNRKIAGVCGGLGEYLGIDPTIVRVIFILLLLPGGVPGFLLYALLWVFIPTESVSVKTKLSNDAEYIPPAKKSK